MIFEPVIDPKSPLEGKILKNDKIYERKELSRGV